MEQAIWLVVVAFAFVLFVLGGFWVIAKAGLPKPVLWAFGAIVLIIILFALVYLVRGNWGSDVRIRVNPGLIYHAQ